MLTWGAPLCSSSTHSSFRPQGFCTCHSPIWGGCPGPCSGSCGEVSKPGGPFLGLPWGTQGPVCFSPSINPSPCIVPVHQLCSHHHTPVCSLRMGPPFVLSAAGSEQGLGKHRRKEGSVFSPTGLRPPEGKYHVPPWCPAQQHTGATAGCWFAGAPYYCSPQ